MLKNLFTAQRKRFILILLIVISSAVIAVEHLFPSFFTIYPIILFISYAFMVSIAYVFMVDMLSKIVFGVIKNKEKSKK